MSSSVCQGLQSCLEPRLVDPHILIHKLAPPKSNSPHPLLSQQKPNVSRNHEQEENYHNEENDCRKYSCNNGDNHDNGGNLSGWNFIQALTNTSHIRKQGTETEQVYVHPLDKRSSCALSTKSLEMCTESLGSETGSDISESINEFASMVLEKQHIDGVQRSKPRELATKVNRSVNFPPPLTSISGSDGVQVRTHREGGRLVIKAVTVSACSLYFQAERADGRLRLSFLKDSTEYDNADKVREEYDDDDGDKDAAADDDDEGDDNCGCWEGDMKGNGGKVRCEVGVGDFPRPSRCKEGGNENKGMPNWGTCWVAIS